MPDNADADVTALAYAPGSGLWVGTATDGLYLLPADSSQRIRHFTTANGLLHNTIYALLADRNGRVWVATHGTGIGAYDPVLDDFVHYRLGSQGLDASSLAEDADGRLWVGTEGQSLYCRQRSGQWQQLTAASKLPSDYTYGILPLPAAPGHRLNRTGAPKFHPSPRNDRWERCACGPSWSFGAPGLPASA